MDTWIQLALNLVISAVALGIIAHYRRKAGRALERSEREVLDQRMRDVLYRAKLYRADRELYESIFRNPHDNWDVFINQHIEDGLLWSKHRLILGNDDEPDPKRVAELKELLARTPRVVM